MSDQELGQLNTIAMDLALLLEQKNTAYGNSFEESAKILAILYPSGVGVEHYQDLLTVTRVIDKLFRIANIKGAFSENPWKDIAGYAILSVWSENRKGMKSGK